MKTLQSLKNPSLSLITGPVLSIAALAGCMQTPIVSEEGARWVAPIQVSSRRATEDTEIRGVAIPKDHVVMTIQASAGHDEEIHENSDQYDLFRAKKTHQSFGTGPHFCQGTHVSRMMLVQLMLPLLFDRFPNMELMTSQDVVWHGFGFRGPLNLPVRLT